MAGGLAGSFLLIPRDSELSLMYFRGHHYADARRLYEQRLAAGDRSVDVVMPLAEVYVQSGEVGRAVDLLRHFGTSAGDRLELFQRVARFQKYGQQMQEYLHTLEAISRIEVSEDGQNFRALRPVKIRWPVSSVNFPKVTARYYRIVLKPQSDWFWRQFADGIPLGEVELHQTPRIEDIPGKAAYIRQDAYAAAQR